MRFVLYIIFCLSFAIKSNPSAGMPPGQFILERYELVTQKLLSDLLNQTLLELNELKKSEAKSIDQVTFAAGFSHVAIDLFIVWNATLIISKNLAWEINFCPTGIADHDAINLWLCKTARDAAQNEAEKSSLFQAYHAERSALSSVAKTKIWQAIKGIQDEALRAALAVNTNSITTVARNNKLTKGGDIWQLSELQVLAWVISNGKTYRQAANRAALYYFRNNFDADLILQNISATTWDRVDLKDNAYTQNFKRLLTNI